MFATFFWQKIDSQSFNFCVEILWYAFVMLNFKVKFEVIFMVSFLLEL